MHAGGVARGEDQTMKFDGPRYYILDTDRRPVEVPILVWAEWHEKNFKDRIVGRTQLTSHVYVSTVFTGMNHRFLGGGPPLLFETMIFGGKLDGNQWRFASWDDAEVGHKAAVRMAQAAQKAHT
jgi:hypothetical protein